MERLQLIQQIQDRMARLDKERSATDIQSKRYDEISSEMDQLRINLTDAMNSQCPVVKD